MGAPPIVKGKVPMPFMEFDTKSLPLRAIKWLYWRLVAGKNYLVAFGRQLRNYSKWVLRFLFSRRGWIANYVKAAFRFSNNYAKWFFRIVQFRIQWAFSWVKRLAGRPYKLPTPIPYAKALAPSSYTLSLRDFSEFFLKSLRRGKKDHEEHPLEHEVIAAPLTKTGNARIPVAAVFHIYYLDLADEMLVKLSEHQQFFSLVVITHSFKIEDLEHLRNLVRTRLQCKVIYKYVENRFRDAKPFIEVLHMPELEGYSAILKLHTKKSPHLNEGASAHWRKDLLDGLLPERAVIARIINALATAPDPVWACPATWISEPKHWGINGLGVWSMTKELGLSYFPKTEFPMGNRYWFNNPFAKEIRNISIPPTQDPKENGWTDGTWAHALERVPGQISKAKGKYIKIPVVKDDK